VSFFFFASFQTRLHSSAATAEALISYLASSRGAKGKKIEK